MDNELEFLFAGFAVFWAALFVYLVLLQMRLRVLQREVETLEERLTEYEGGTEHQVAANTTPVATAPATTTGESSAPASPADA